MLSYISKRINDRIGHLRFNSRGYFPYFGTQVYAPKGCVLYTRLRHEGVFERDTCHYLVKAARDGTWFLDVGANLGLMSAPVLAQKPGVKVLSIEPSPNSHPYLKQTRDHSPYADRWQTVSKAVSRNTGTVDFVLADESHAAFEGMRDTGRVSMKRKVQVETAPLDAIWESVGSPPVSLIKIDVEGAETEVLEGARKLLANCRPTVVLEWNPINLQAYGTPLGWILEFARANDYFFCDMSTMAAIEHAEHLEHLSSQGRENFVLYPKNTQAS